MAGDGGLPEGVCIPRTPGRTFGPCSAGRLAAGGRPSLPGAPGVLFPINVLFTVTWYQDFPPVSSAAFPGGVRLTLIHIQVGALIVPHQSGAQIDGFDGENLRVHQNVLGEGNIIPGQ